MTGGRSSEGRGGWGCAKHITPCTTASCSSTRDIRSEYMHWCIMHGIIMVPKLNEITIYSTVYTHTFIHSTISAYNVHGNRGMFWHFPLYQVLTTNKWLSASALGRWPLIAGRPTLTLKCVGTLIMCPYMTGGRSRRGSPKAGTTVLRMRSSSPLTSWHFKSGYLFVIALGLRAKLGDPFFEIHKIGHTPIALTTCNKCSRSAISMLHYTWHARMTRKSRVSSRIHYHPKESYA